MFIHLKVFIISKLKSRQILTHKSYLPNAWIFRVQPQGLMTPLPPLSLPLEKRRPVTQALLWQLEA